MISLVGGASPISADSVELFDGGDEALRVAKQCLLNTKVVDNEREDEVMCVVLPKAISGQDRCIFMPGEAHTFHSKSLPQTRKLLWIRGMSWYLFIMDW